MNVRDLLTRPENVPFLTLTAAARLLPGEGTGKGVSPSTIYRWGTKGLPLPGGRVVRLVMWRVGRKWVTSREALADFIDAQQSCHSNAPTGG